MEEEQQKRNTDCVYFLASPLTCRKGAECEYRHSEIARLNPRDCWFWLSGNCLNPSCAFRHPPLEKQAESALESDTFQQQASVPTNKTNVPCYFYSNGFCSKGDKCSFLHGASTFVGKFVRTSSAVTDGLRSDDKTFVGSKIIPAAKKVNASLPVAVPKPNVDLNMQHKEDVRETVPKRVIQDPPPQIAVSQHEEAIVANFSSVLQAGDLSRSKSYLSSYQYLEEPVDDHFEPEERRESSPGFDVLVDDKSKCMAYDDDEEYLQALERDDRELNGQFMRDDFVDPIEYDPAHPNTEHFYEGEMIDSYDWDNVRIYDGVGKDYGCPQDRMLESVLSRKRKVLPVDIDMNDRGGVDLRDHLRKHRISDGRVRRSSTSSGSLNLLRLSEEKPLRHGISQRLHERLVLEARIPSVGLLGDNGTFSNGGHQCGWIPNTQLERSRLHYNGRKPVERQLIPSDEVLRKPGPRDKIYTEEHVTFSGPKSLAQIKEEKKKAEENGGCTGIMGQSIASADFEGPKPLSEILKEKRKLGSVVAACES